MYGPVRCRIRHIVRNNVCAVIIDIHNIATHDNRAGQVTVAAVHSRRARVRVRIAAFNGSRIVAEKRDHRRGRVHHIHRARCLGGGKTRAVRHIISNDINADCVRINNIAADNDGSRQITVTTVHSRRASVRVRIAAFNVHHRVTRQRNHWRGRVHHPHKAGVIYIGAKSACVHKVGVAVAVVHIRQIITRENGVDIVRGVLRHIIKQIIAGLRGKRIVSTQIGNTVVFVKPH